MLGGVCFHSEIAIMTIKDAAYRMLRATSREQTRTLIARRCALGARYRSRALIFAPAFFIFHAAAEAEAKERMRRISIVLLLRLNARRHRKNTIFLCATFCLSKRHGIQTGGSGSNITSREGKNGNGEMSKIMLRPSAGVTGVRRPAAERAERNDYILVDIIAAPSYSRSDATCCHFPAPLRIFASSSRCVSLSARYRRLLLYRSACAARRGAINDDGRGGVTATCTTVPLSCSHPAKMKNYCFGGMPAESGRERNLSGIGRRIEQPLPRLWPLRSKAAKYLKKLLLAGGDIRWTSSGQLCGGGGLAAGAYRHHLPAAGCAEI